MSIWRIRARISVFADLNPSYKIRGNDLLFTKELSLRNGANIYLADVIIESEKIEEALFKGLELIDEMLDRISYLTNAKAELIKIISVVPPKVGKNEEFDICLPYGCFNRTSILEISPNIFESFDDVEKESPDMISLHHYRKGLSAYNPLNSFQHYWIATETLAEKEAKIRGINVEKKCPKCKCDLPSHPAQQVIIREKFNKLGPEYVMDEADAKKKADEARIHRGKLIHGCLSNKDFRDKTINQNRILQPTSALTLANALNIKLLCRQTEHIRTPLTTLKLKLTDSDKYEPVPPLDFKVAAAFSKIPDEFAENGSFNYFFGLQSPIEIETAALPALEEN